MMCPASDRGSSFEVDTYPGRWGSCIRVGAATATGERCAYVHENEIDCLFPGDTVPFIRGSGTPLTYVSGSSVATALAAGMAALLLYCNRLAAGPGEEATAAADAELHSRSGIRKAFRAMSLAKDCMFPRVEQFFGKKRFKNWERALALKEANSIAAAVIQNIKAHGL